MPGNPAKKLSCLSKRIGVVLNGIFHYCGCENSVKQIWTRLWHSNEISRSDALTERQIVYLSAFKKAFFLNAEYRSNSYEVDRMWSEQVV